MNRCRPSRLGATLSIALTLTLLPLTLLAQSAQPRALPAQALVASLRVELPPIITLDGKPERLSPGARIHGPDNLLVLSASLVGQTLKVRALRDNLGLIQEVWILNPAELAAVDTPQPSISQNRP